MPGIVILAVLTTYFISAFSNLYMGSGVRQPPFDVCNGYVKIFSISSIPATFLVLLSPAVRKMPDWLISPREVHFPPLAVWYVCWLVTLRPVFLK